MQTNIFGVSFWVGFNWRIRCKISTRAHTQHKIINIIFSFSINLRKTFRSKSFRIYGNVEPIEMHIDFDENQINKLDTDNNAQFYYC